MLSAPEPLTDDHVLDDFDSGVDSLNTWLQRRAGANQLSGASRTFVPCEDGRVVGYYALASNAVAPAAATGRCWRRSNSDPLCRPEFDPGLVADHGVTGCG